MGINVNKVIARTFFFGSALAGAAGIMAEGGVDQSGNDNTALGVHFE